MSLQERSAEAFEAAFSSVDSDGLDSARDALTEARRRLDEPMRVAIVGQIKAGKSTMLNALLGEELVSTGPKELTFNVNWLRYAESQSLRVHFRNGRAPEEHSLPELEALTARREENREFLSSIRFIEVFYPNEILRSFNLIDTPGLDSHYVRDSENTLEFLGMSVADFEESTRKESSNADAVVCLFSRSLAASDQKLVAKFQGPLLGAATPINAIGVLTHVEGYWSPEQPDRDPLEPGRTVTSRIFGEPEANRVFYTIAPVCSKVALGAQTLTEGQLKTLTQLASLPSERLLQALDSVEEFAGEEAEDLSVPAVRRREVLERLERWGVWLACGLIRDGATELDALKAQLLERSELPKLRELLISHFGNRALLIKLGTSLRKVKPVLREARQASNGDAVAVREAERILERLELKEHAFKELDVLRTYYSDPEGAGLTPEEEKQLVEVTGEHGTSCAARLGLANNVGTAEMLAVAAERMQHWTRRSRRLAASLTTRQLAESVTACFERIQIHVAEAQCHLELAHRHLELEA